MQFETYYRDSQTQVSRSPVVDDLATGQTGMSVEDLDGSGVALHGPMEDARLRHEGDRVQRDPLPEDNVVRHRVRLHLRLHLDVENLEGLLRCKNSHNS